MSDTPRTDKLLVFINKDPENPYRYCKLRDHARQLERELAEARREIQKICQQQADADAEKDKQ